MKHCVELFGDGDAASDSATKHTDPVISVTTTVEANNGLHCIG